MKLSQMNFFQPAFALSHDASVMFQNGATISRYGTAAKAAKEYGQLSLVKITAAIA
jgi:hypothetical protein